MKENEYNYFIEYEAKGLTVLPCIPVFIAALLYKAEISLPVYIGSILVGLTFSLVILFSSKISRELFKKIMLYKVAVITHYLLVVLIPVTSYLPQIKSPLSELIGTLSFAVGLCAGLVLYFHFFTPKYLSQIGWFTKDPAVLSPENGSKTGNKIALVLAFLSITLVVLLIFVASTTT